MGNSWGNFLQPSVVNVCHCEWKHFLLLHVKDSLDEKSNVDVSEGPLYDNEMLL